MHFCCAQPTIDIRQKRDFLGQFEFMEETRRFLCLVLHMSLVRKLMCPKRAFLGGCHIILEL